MMDYINEYTQFILKVVVSRPRGSTARGAEMKSCPGTVTLNLTALLHQKRMTSPCVYISQYFLCSDT